MNDDGTLVGTSGVWPVCSGRSFNLWEPDTGEYYDSIDEDRIKAHLFNKRQSQRANKRSAFYLLDEAVTSNPDTLPCLHPRVAFRGVTNATNTRTMVAALVPGNRVLVTGAPYLLPMDGSTSDEAYLLGVLCSMPCDWQARRIVELNFKFFHLNQLAIPDPGEGHPTRDRVVEIAGRLAAVDERFADWAAEVGVPVGSANEEPVKQDLIHELDACVAHLYEFDEEDLAVLYATFDEKKPEKYADRHAAVLAHFRRLA